MGVIWGRDYLFLDHRLMRMYDCLVQWCFWCRKVHLYLYITYAPNTSEDQEHVFLPMLKERFCLVCSLMLVFAQIKKIWSQSRFKCWNCSSATEWKSILNWLSDSVQLFSDLFIVTYNHIQSTYWHNLVSQSGTIKIRTCVVNVF